MPTNQNLNFFKYHNQFKDAQATKRNRWILLFTNPTRRG